jgi:hypothetical protein
MATKPAAMIRKRAAARQPDDGAAEVRAEPSSDVTPDTLPLERQEARHRKPPSPSAYRDGWATMSTSSEVAEATGSESCAAGRR